MTEHPAEPAPDVPVYGTQDSAPVPGMPIYGTPDGVAEPGHDEPRDVEPRKGAPHAPASEQTRGSGAATSGFLQQVERRTQRFLARLAGRELRPETFSDGVDWRNYPGTFEGDALLVLLELRQHEVVERNEKLLCGIRELLTANDSLHWQADSADEGLSPETNTWGGESMLETWTSATWRSTSGFVDHRARHRVASVVRRRLKRNGFVDITFEILDDRLLLTAEEIAHSDTRLALSIGANSLALVMASSCTLAAARADEFRERMLAYESKRPPAAD